MRLVKTIAEMRRLSDGLRSQGSGITLVPTMGALHEGHLALVEEAANHARPVTVSIFVNPTQFGPNEDFRAYPRTLADDCRKLAQTDMVDSVFAPSVEAMYPDGGSLTRVEVDQLSDRMCGISRPGHFRGVATVVAKLFNICRPIEMVFGLKDAQQFYLLDQMIRDLNMDVRLIGVPIVRESDGVALSSRNKYLTPEERRQAPILFRALSRASEMIAGGERDGRRITECIRSVIAKATSGRIDYIELVETGRFQPVEGLQPGMRVVAAVAVYFGKARLIDNTIITIPD